MTAVGGGALIPFAFDFAKMLSNILYWEVGCALPVVPW